MYRVPQRLWRGVEGPRRCLSRPCCSELFQPPKPENTPAGLTRLSDQPRGGLLPAGKLPAELTLFVRYM
jgi:hypothetical protein